MSLQGHRVLLVDDDHSIRAVLGATLRFAGHEVLECLDGNEALAILDRHAGAINILIADHTMPGMSGMALAREVERTAPWIQTLIISGHSAPESECRRTHGVAFLAKPFGADELLRTLQRFHGPRAMRPRSVRMIESPIEVAL